MNNYDGAKVWLYINFTIKIIVNFFMQTLWIFILAFICAVGMGKGIVNDFFEFISRKPLIASLIVLIIITILAYAIYIIKPIKDRKLSIVYWIISVLLSMDYFFSFAFGFGGIVMELLEKIAVWLYY